MLTLTEDHEITRIYTRKDVYHNHRELCGVYVRHADGGYEEYVDIFDLAKQTDIAGPMLMRYEQFLRREANRAAGLIDKLKPFVKDPPWQPVWVNGELVNCRRKNPPQRKS